MAQRVNESMAEKHPVRVNTPRLCGRRGIFRITMPMLFIVFLASFSFSAQAAPPPIIGRWDITVQRPEGDRSAWLEVRHSGTSTLVGVSGCLYGVRRDAYRPIDPTLISDFVVAMRMREQGLRTVLEPSAVCFEDTLDKSHHELAMRRAE